MKFSCCAISTLELGHPGHGLPVLRFGLLVVALGNRALLETHPLQPRRFAQALRRALRDFESAGPAPAAGCSRWRPS